MKRRIWDLYAPVYAWVMRSDRKVYHDMYVRIEARVRHQDVLELATGPGLLAKQVAESTRSMIATDYSEGMIKQAKKGTYSDKLRFEIADAEHLPYEDHALDVVIIANALHILPHPELALDEIRRVLRPDGLLICPNFVVERRQRLWHGILKLAGVTFEHQWDKDAYPNFLREHGWTIEEAEYMPARIPIMYVTCKASCSAVT